MFLHDLVSLFNFQLMVFSISLFSWILDVVDLAGGTVGMRIDPNFHFPPQGRFD